MVLAAPRSSADALCDSTDTHINIILCLSVLTAISLRWSWVSQFYWNRGQAGNNVDDVLPVTTPRGKQMMPPADRIYDPGQGAKKDLTDTGDDFLAIDLALRIMQLNVEGLSAAKREVISSIAERQKIPTDDSVQHTVCTP